MNKEEKRHILTKCYMYFNKAKMIQHKDFMNYIKYKGAGQALKKIIEELIDCQCEPYYSYYIKIVELANELDNIKNGD